MVLKNQALHKETVALQQRLHAAELQVEVEKLKVQEQQDAKERLREEITTLQKEVQGLSQKMQHSIENYSRKTKTSRRNEQRDRPCCSMI